MAATQKVRLPPTCCSQSRARDAGGAALCRSAARATHRARGFRVRTCPSRRPHASARTAHRAIIDWCYTLYSGGRENDAARGHRGATLTRVTPTPNHLSLEPLPLLLSFQAPSSRASPPPLQQQGGAYWTVSFGVCTRLGLTCRECRAPLFKGQRIAARDGRKIRLTYHDECFSGDADPRTQLNASSAEGRLPQACFSQQAPARKGRGKWSTSYGLMPAPAGTPTKARVVSTPEPAQRPARAGGDGSTRAQAMRGPGGRRPATPQWH